MSTPDKTAPKPRRQMKITTALGRQLMKEERQRLAREQALQAERMVNEAKAQREAKFNRDEPRAPKQQTLINRSVVRRTAAVLASEKVVVPIRVRQGDTYTGTKAWTDFKSIDITFEPEEDIRLLSAQLRGLLYHEGGHCRFTDPFLDLVEAVREVLGEVPTPDGVDVNRLHRAWNCLEDQRMETAVVSDAPRKAAFFTPMVMAMHLRSLDHMAANYPLLVWRRYLPIKLRRQARTMFVTLHGAQGEHFAQELDRIVTSYVTATDVETMWTAVCEYHELLQAMKPLASNMDDAGHAQQRSRKGSKDDSFQGLSIPIDPSMLDETPPMCTDDFGLDMDEDEDDEDWDDLPWTEEGFEHFLDILITLLNGGDVFEVRYVDNRPQQSEEGESEQVVGDLSDEDEADGSDGAEDDQRRAPKRAPRAKPVTMTPKTRLTRMPTMRLGTPGRRSIRTLTARTRQTMPTMPTATRTTSRAATTANMGVHRLPQRHRRARGRTTSPSPRTTWTSCSKRPRRSATTAATSTATCRRTAMPRRTTSPTSTRTSVGSPTTPS